MTNRDESSSGFRAFDPAVLQEQTAGDAALTQELIQLCLEQCPPLLEQIRQGVRAGDVNAIRFGAHTLKGALMNFGAVRAVSAARELEQMGREQRLDSVHATHQELEAAWIELARELKSHLD